MVSKKQNDFTKATCQKYVVWHMSASSHLRFWSDKTAQEPDRISKQTQDEHFKSTTQQTFILVLLTVSLLILLLNYNKINFQKISEKIFLFQQKKNTTRLHTIQYTDDRMQNKQVCIIKK